MKSSFCLFFLHNDCKALVGSRRNVGEEAHCVQHRVREFGRECHILPDQVRKRLATLGLSGISCMLSGYPAGTQRVLRGYSYTAGTQRVLGRHFMGGVADIQVYVRDSVRTLCPFVLSV